MKLKKLTSTQKKAASEIAGNIATAWFVGGIVTPVISPQFTSGSLILKSVILLVLTGSFTYISLFLVRRKRL